MKNVSQETIDSFIQSCHRAAEHGLVRCSSGNLSMRVDSDRFLVTASRSWLAEVTPEDIALCLIADLSLLEGAKPSVESGIHAGVLGTRPDVNVVIHFQTPSATALACQAVQDINFNVIPEIPFYMGPIARIPYLLPGSPELALAVTEAMRDHDVVVMANHGQVTAAGDADHAIQNAVFFELACEIILHSGDRGVPLPDKEIQAILELRRTANSGS